MKKIVVVVVVALLICSLSFAQDFTINGSSAVLQFPSSPRAELDWPIKDLWYTKLHTGKVSFVRITTNVTTGEYNGYDPTDLSFNGTKFANFDAFKIWADENLGKSKPSGGGTNDASGLTSGVLADNRLSENVTKEGNTFNGNNQLIKTDGQGRLPALDGSLLTGIQGGTGQTSEQVAAQIVAGTGITKTVDGNDVVTLSATGGGSADGSETKINSTASVTVAGTGTVASPYQLTAVGEGLNQIPDYTSLRALTGMSDGDLVYINDPLRYGIFRYDSNLSSTDNSGTIIQGWSRDNPYSLKIRYYGGVRDGIVDDTQSVKDLLVNVPNQNNNDKIDPTFSWNEDPNGIIRITEEILISKNQFLINFNNSSIYSDFVGKAINTRFSRGTTIRDMKIILPIDSVGVVGLSFYKSYTTKLENVRVETDFASGSAQINTISLELIAGLGDGGDNLYFFADQFGTGKTGLGISIITPDPEYTRNNHIVFNEPVIFSNRGMYIEGTSSITVNSGALESRATPLEFRENEHGVVTTDNVFKFTYFESNGESLSDESCDGNIITYQFGAGGLKVPHNTVIQTRFKEKRNLIGQNVVSDSDFNIPRKWFNEFVSPSNSSVINGKATFNIVNGQVATIYQGFDFIPNDFYKVSATINGDVGGSARFVDSSGNEGGLKAQQTVVEFNGYDQEIEFLWKANKKSEIIMISRSATGDYNFTVDNLQVMRLLDSEHIVYNDFQNDLNADNVQSAIDSLKSKISGTRTTDLDMGGFSIINASTAVESLSLINQINNGSADTDSEWTSKLNSTIANGVITLNIAQGGNSAIGQSISLITGREYELQFDANTSSAGQTLRVFDSGGGNNGALTTSNGKALVSLEQGNQSYKIRFIAVLNSTNLYFTRHTNFTAWSVNLDNISIREIINQNAEPIQIEGDVNITGNIISTNLPNATSLATDATGRIIAGTGGGTSTIPDNSITTAKIVDGTILEEDLAPAVVTKLNNIITSPNGTQYIIGVSNAGAITVTAQ